MDVICGICYDDVSTALRITNLTDLVSSRHVIQAGDSILRTTRSNMHHFLCSAYETLRSEFSEKLLTIQKDCCSVTQFSSVWNTLTVW
jgi:hypothetical protein